MVVSFRGVHVSGLGGCCVQASSREFRDSKVACKNLLQVSNFWNFWLRVRVSPATTALTASRCEGLAARFMCTVFSPYFTCHARVLERVNSFECVFKDDLHF